MLKFCRVYFYTSNSSLLTVFSFRYIKKPITYHVAFSILPLANWWRGYRDFYTKIGVTNINPALPTRHYDMQERKLIEIAKCMYNDPELLIVDEITTALSQSGREIKGHYYRVDNDGYSDEVVLKANCITTMESLLCFDLKLHNQEILGIGGNVKDKSILFKEAIR